MSVLSMVMAGSFGMGRENLNSFLNGLFRLL